MTTPTCTACCCTLPPDEAAAEIQGMNAWRSLLEACHAFLGNLDHLRDVWGDEGVTRTVCDKARAAIAEATRKGGDA